MKLNLKLNSNDSDFKPGLHDNFGLNFQVSNGTHYAFVNENSEGRCRLERVVDNDNETTFALLANLYVCEGKPGKVIKVRAKKRTGKLDFISCMQKALEKHYEDKFVGRSITTHCDI